MKGSVCYDEFYLSVFWASGQKKKGKDIHYYASSLYIGMNCCLWGEKSSRQALHLAQTAQHPTLFVVYNDISAS